MVIAFELKMWLTPLTSMPNFTVVFRNLVIATLSKVAKPADMLTLWVPTTVPKLLSMPQMVIEADENEPVVTRLPLASMISTTTGDMVTPAVAEVD